MKVYLLAGKKTMRTMIALLVLGLCAGCIMPVPHRRVHSYGVQGRIVDAFTQAPVEGAVVTSQDQKTRETRASDHGQFSLRPAYGWHGAYFISPISRSLFPGWGVTFPGAAIEVTAVGYQKEHFLIRSENAIREGSYLKVGDLRLKPTTAAANELRTEP